MGCQEHHRGMRVKDPKISQRIQDDGKRDSEDDGLPDLTLPPDYMPHYTSMADPNVDDSQ